MVETVIVLPVLLLVLFGVLELSVVLGRWQALSNAAREGARRAVVFRSACNVDTVRAEVEASVVLYGAALGLGPDQLHVEVAGACGPRDTTSTVTVRSDYRFRVLSRLGDGLAPSIEMVASSVMRNEGSS